MGRNYDVSNLEHAAKKAASEPVIFRKTLLDHKSWRLCELQNIWIPDRHDDVLLCFLIFFYILYLSFSYMHRLLCVTCMSDRKPTLRFLPALWSSYCQTHGWSCESTSSCPLITAVRRRLYPDVSTSLSSLSSVSSSSPHLSDWTKSSRRQHSDSALSQKLVCTYVVLF